MPNLFGCFEVVSCHSFIINHLFNHPFDEPCQGHSSNHHVKNFPSIKSLSMNLISSSHDFELGIVSNNLLQLFFFLRVYFLLMFFCAISLIIYLIPILLSYIVLQVPCFLLFFGFNFIFLMTLPLIFLIRFSTSIH